MAAARRRGLALWVLATLWLVSGNALAQPIWDVIADPEASSFATRLLEADQNRSPDFQRLVSEQPGLSRRAFVIAVLQAAKLDSSDPSTGAGYVSLAARLATHFEQLFSDPEPWAILRDIDAKLETVDARLMAYWDRHRQNKRPLANDNDEEDRYWESPAFPPDVDDATHRAMRPLLAKGLRVELAALLSHPRLLIAEYDSYDGVARDVLANLEPEIRDSLNEDFRLGLELTKLFLQAELGLLADLPSEIDAFLKKNGDPATEAGLWLAAYRAAARQGQWELSESYLSKARGALGADYAEPVLRYCLGTADYQLRCAKGYEPTAAQALSEFSSCWSLLDRYTPKTLIGDDYDWPAGRAATKFWIDEFQRFPATRKPAMDAIWKRFEGWIMAVDSQGLELPGESLLWHQDEFAGHNAYFLALLDSFTYLLEATPEASDEEGGLLELVLGLRGLVGDFVRNSEGELFQIPGQPRFELGSAGLVPELYSRLYYLESLAGKTPTEKKVELLKQARSEILKCENSETTVKYLLLYGERFFQYGFESEAQQSSTEALELAERASLVSQGAQAATRLAELTSKAGQWQAAEQYSERAKELLKGRLPLGVRDAAGREAAEQSWRITQLQTQAAIEQKAPEKAWSALSHGQQQQSSTLQMEAHKGAQRDLKRSLEVESGVATVAREVDRLKSLPASPTRDQLLGQGEKLLADSRGRYLTESRALRQKYADTYGRVLKVDPLSLAEIQSGLPKELAVVQYFPTPDALYIFLVTSESFRLQQVDIGQQALDGEIVTFLRALRRATAGDAAIPKGAQALYQRLIAPIAGQLESAKTILFIPTGRLNGIPFACLEDASGSPLAANKTIVELAKATDLSRLASQTEKLESVVAFANATGDLPAASREGQRITELFPQSKLFTGKQATKSAFLEIGGQGQVLHLATHGEWNLEDSLQNYLALAGGEKVSQEEIFALDLSQKSLVMLSACNTAMGEGQNLNYVASLAEAFWLAGSRSVVASLWAVNDESTSLLVSKFYEALKAGDDKAEALRKAQMAVRSQPQFAHPYYWSGFVLFGDWR